MSDLDSKLRGLRDELTAAIPLPDVDRVTGRARTRRKLQLGAIAAVVAVVAAVPVLRSLPIWGPAAPVPARTSYTVDFADRDHGYALAKKCVHGTQGCEFTLYRTADGGSTWQPRKLPRAPGDGFWEVLYVLGPDAVTIGKPTGPESARIFSIDGGRSWGVAEDSSLATTQSHGTAPLRTGGMMTGECGAQPYAGEACDEIGSIDPDSGRFVAAPTQPPLIPSQVGQVATEGGRWWVVGQTHVTHQVALAVSADGGRTWLVSELGEYAEQDEFAVVERDDVLYATAGHVHGPFSVWRSTDEGRSWTKTRDIALSLEEMNKGEDAASNDAGGDRAPLEVNGFPTAAEDGSLIVSDKKSTTYVSTDGGRSFERAGAAVGWVKWTRAGYLRTDFDKFALSTDGLQWKEFTVS